VESVQRFLSNAIVVEKNPHALVKKNCLSGKERQLTIGKKNYRKSG
jgi:hypothetical protein